MRVFPNPKVVDKTSTYGKPFSMAFQHRSSEGDPMSRSGVIATPDSKGYPERT
jgi:hypothetical protein